MKKTLLLTVALALVVVGCATKEKDALVPVLWEGMSVRLIKKRFPGMYCYDTTAKFHIAGANYRVFDRCRFNGPWGRAAYNLTFRNGALVSWSNY